MMLRYKPLIVLFALATLIAGCAGTSAKKLAKAERLYAVTARSFGVAVDAGVIKGDALDALAFASVEANESLRQANLRKGEVGSEFYIDRALSAVERFVRLQAEATK